MKNKYKVRGQYFEKLEDAIEAAKRQAMNRSQLPHAYCMIYDAEVKVFVACVTDDANGIKVNKLYGWPVKEVASEVKREPIGKYLYPVSDTDHASADFFDKRPLPPEIPNHHNRPLVQVLVRIAGGELAWINIDERQILRG